jgi:tetratricopeptide (TPR) repeat protein
VNDTAGCIAAYERALELDPEYDLAWFNLGGIYFNADDIPAARATWTEALRRFPEHTRAADVRAILSRLTRA